MIVQDSETIFDHGTLDQKVSVVIPLYNYADFIIETLESVGNQSFRDLAIIVVDDASTDRSVPTVKGWMERAAGTGPSLLLARNLENAKLAITRNTGASLARSDYCFFLDADNTLYPRCIEKHVAALDARPDAAAAYSLVEVFGEIGGLMNTTAFHQTTLRHGNRIDAMAMYRLDVLRTMGGVHHIPYGWEDYDLWLRLCEQQHIVLHIPEILSRYREHAASMHCTDTNIPEHIRKLRALIKQRHPWLELH